MNSHFRQQSYRTRDRTAYCHPQRPTMEKWKIILPVTNIRSKIAKLPLKEWQADNNNGNKGVF